MNERAIGKVVEKFLVAGDSSLVARYRPGVEPDAPEINAHPVPAALIRSGCRTGNRLRRRRSTAVSFNRSVVQPPSRSTAVPQGGRLPSRVGLAGLIGVVVGALEILICVHQAVAHEIGIEQ